MYGFYCVKIRNFILFSNVDGGISSEGQLVVKRFDRRPKHEIKWHGTLLRL